MTDRRPDPGTGREVDDGLDFFAMKNVVHRARIAQIGLMHRDLVRYGRDVAALDFRIVKIVEVIQDRNLMAGGEELLDEMRPDEPGAARHENFHCASVRRER
jgi:hypothetical protein